MERRARRANVEDPQVVMEAAAAFLAVRQRSVTETRRRLLSLGYPPLLRDQAVQRLTELGYLDDVAFARAWVEGRDRVRPRGEHALRRELQARGIAEATIGLVLGERRARPVDGPGGGDPAAAGDVAAAHRLVERRRASLSRDPDPRRRRQKAYALLARNGFDPEVCQHVANDVFAAPTEDAGGVLRCDGSASRLRCSDRRTGRR